MISKQIAGSSGAQLGEWEQRGEETSPAIFWKSNKESLFLKKGPDFVHFWVRFFIQNVV